METGLLGCVEWLKFTDVTGRLLGPMNRVSEELPIPSQAKPSQAKPSQAKSSQAKPSQAKSSNWGAETCEKRKSTSPCLLAIPAFDRKAGLNNRICLR